MADEFEQFRAQASGLSSLPSTPPNRKLFSSYHASFRSDRPYSSRRRLDGDTLALKLADLRLNEIKGRVIDRASSPGGSRESMDMTEDDDAVFQESSKHAYPPSCRPHSPMLYQARAFNLSPDTSHKRSLSCRARVRRPRELPLSGVATESSGVGMRRRTYSMPTKNPYRRPRKDAPHTRSSRHGSEADAEDEEDKDENNLVRVRTFSSSARGFTNRGDSFKRRSTSTQALSDPCPQRANSFRQRTWSATSQGSSVGSGGSSSATTPKVHRVLVLGAHGVGKTSLIQQFMTSEYMGNSEVLSEEEEWKTVSVLLDGQESTLEFKDLSPIEVEPPNQTAADAYVVVYSVADKDSFDDAVDCLHELRKKQQLSGSAAILVANKYDMVRNREVEETEGKRMAIIYDCKYIEVSAVLNHKVDELLAGILKQIRLKEKKLAKRRRGCIPDENGCIPQARDIFGKLLRRNQPMFRSCDNLLVL